MKWLTNYEDISNADDESLRYSIITGDGRGKAFKTAVLDEIIKREVQKKLNPPVVELIVQPSEEQPKQRSPITEEQLMIAIEKLRNRPNVKPPPEFWKKVADSARRLESDFAEREKRLEPTWESMHRPFTI